jgi:hypothetical protein
MQTDSVSHHVMQRNPSCIVYRFSNNVDDIEEKKNILRVVSI